MEGRMMADESRKLSITYVSGLIPPPEIMSTLAVFYDEIWLPQPYDLDIENSQRLGEQYALFSKAHYEIDSIRGLELAQREFYRWKTKWILLFEQCLLLTLPPISLYDLEKPLVPGKFIFTDFSYEGICTYYVDKIKYAMQRLLDSEDSDIVFGQMCLKFVDPFLASISVFSNKKNDSILFIDDLSDTRTSHLAAFLIHSLFQYSVPKLQALNAEQILEVRDYLKDTKEGFTYYINQMTDDVEQRIKSGNLTGTVAAQKTFERKILPLYAEFRRQLAAKKTGYWANVLSASADFFKVDATPWTPKFLGELLKWFGVALNLTAKDEEGLLTNQSQAFQYLATLEKKLS
jgi:hypothetical protein